MPDIMLHSVVVSYDTAGDGFPLLMVPDSDGTATAWNPYVPLFAELCRVITYAVPAATQVSALNILRALCDTLELERIYLACYAAAWSLAVEYALQQMGRLEGVVFLGTRAAGLVPDGVHRATLPTMLLRTITVPTLVLLEESCVATLPEADVLTAHLPRNTRVVVSTAEADVSTHGASLPLGHAMMRFLLHCERQRNLVRGASFLL